MRKVGTAGTARQGASDHDFLCNEIRFGAGLPITVTLTASILYQLGLESVGLLLPFIVRRVKVLFGSNTQHERFGGYSEM